MRKNVFLIFLFCAFFSFSVFAASDYEKALKLYSRGEYKEAVRILDQYTEKTPEPSAYYLLGYAQYNLGRYKEANENFSNAFLIDPEFSPRQLLKQVEEIKAKEGKQAKKAVISKPTAKTPAKAAEKAASKLETKPAQTVTQMPQATIPKPTEQPVKTPLAPSEAPVTSIEEKPAATPPEPAPENIVKPAVMKPKAELPQPGFLENPMALIGILFVIILYLYFSACLFFIARKLNVPAPWTAFVPLVQLWAIARAADMPGWWAALLVVPVVNFFVMAYLFMRIADNLGKSLWLGLLMLVPVVNLILLGLLAFKGEKIEAVAEEEISSPETSGDYGLEGLEKAPPEATAEDISEGLSEWSPESESTLKMAEPEETNLEETTSMASQTIPYIETEKRPSFIKRLANKLFRKKEIIKPVEADSPALTETTEGMELPELQDEGINTSDAGMEDTAKMPSALEAGFSEEALQDTQKAEPETFSFGDSSSFGDEAESFDLPDIDLDEPSEGPSFTESPEEKTGGAPPFDAPGVRETQEFSGTTKMEAAPDFETMELEPQTPASPEGFETMELGPTTIQTESAPEGFETMQLDAPSEQDTGEGEFMGEYTEAAGAEDAGSFESTEKLPEGEVGEETAPSGKKLHVKPLLGALAFAAALAAAYYVFLK